MEISNYTTEDFVLDPAFKKWVMYPDGATNLFWENLLAENPSKHKKAKKASRIILQLNIKNQPILSDTEISDMWKDLDSRLSKDNQNVKIIFKKQ